LKYSYNEKHKKQYADGIESVNIKDGLNVHARELAPVYSFTHIRTLRTVDTPDCGLLVLVPLSHPTLPSLKSAESFQAREDPAASQHPRAWKRLELQVTSSKRIQALRCTSKLVKPQLLFSLMDIRGLDTGVLTKCIKVNTYTAQSLELS